MNVQCVEQDRVKLRQMRKDATEIVHGARIIPCRDPCKAETVAKVKGCDVLGQDLPDQGHCEEAEEEQEAHQPEAHCKTALLQQQQEDRHREQERQDQGKSQGQL